MDYLRKFKIILTGLLLALIPAVPAVAQTVANPDDGSTLKQTIIFGRHSVRSSTVDPATLATYSADSYPDFGVPKGYLTPHGQLAAGLLGSYFRAYLLHERLLTGNDRADLAHSYFRANSIQRSNVTAAMFGAGLIPGATIPVHSFPLGTADPVFDPLATGVATVDATRAVTEAQGILGSAAALKSAYSGELSLVRSVLFDYPLGTQPPPTAPPSLVDPTADPFLLEASTTTHVTGYVINPGALEIVINAADPFVMEYADGLPPEKVGWGRLSPDALSQQTRLTTLVFQIAMQLPYLARVQSSNAASHVLRSMEQVVIGDDIAGAFGDARSRTIVVISSDAYVAGLAGLLDMHWALPGYQPDFCAPGGALVFELRQARRSREYFVRVFYTAQTFDQLRNLTPLTLNAPPATMQLLIPVDGRLEMNSDSRYDVEPLNSPGRDLHPKSVTGLDVRFDVFKKLLRKAIDRKCVQDPFEEVLPGVLTDVPLN